MSAPETPRFSLRKALVSDVPRIAEIINVHAKKGIMLSRPISRIYDNIRDYTVVEIDGEVAGCGSLHVMWSDLGEIRSVALREDIMGKGIGRPLTERLIAEAEDLGLEKVFALTYRREFFEKVGFSVIDKSELPHKIWSECINCVHFPNCDEIAMIRILKKEAVT